MSDTVPKTQAFTCSVCREPFTSSRPEEEAVKELKDTFGEDLTTQECSVVCEDCYRTLFGGTTH